MTDCPRCLLVLAPLTITHGNMLHHLSRTFFPLALHIMSNFYLFFHVICAHQGWNILPYISCLTFRLFQNGPEISFLHWFVYAFPQAVLFLFIALLYLQAMFIGIGYALRILHGSIAASTLSFLQFFPTCLHSI